MGNDLLKELFQERFHGHEAPVDPGVWEAIASRLPDALPADDGGDGLRELFQDRFQGHEAHVDPALWDAIGQQLGHGASVGSGSAGMFSGATGWIAGGVAAVLLAGGLYLALDGPAEEQTRQEMAEVTSAPQETTGQVEVEVPAPATGPELTPEDRPAVTTMPTGSRTAPPMPTTVSPGPVTGDDEPATGATEQSSAGPEERLSPVQTMVERQQEAPGAALVDAIITDLTQRVEDQPEQVVAITPPGRVSMETEDQAHEDHVEPEETQSFVPITLFMPNVFTPDGDGVNEEYVIEGEGFDHITIKVFSAQNNRLVFSADRLLPWDGTDMQTGQQCPDGYYMVAVEARGLDGRTVPQGKVVWLNRNTMR